ncbi:MAG: hypothetical protein D6780_02600, partial [Candidatus Dadabacteria bacterium]
MDINFFLDLAKFLFVLLASQQLGKLVQRAHLPAISGFIIVGVVAGPYLLNYLDEDVISEFSFTYTFTLPFIGLAAGAELVFSELQKDFKRLLILAASIVFFGLLIGATSLLLLVKAGFIPFEVSLRFKEAFSISILGAVILIATSPSSAIAVIKEVKAAGRFTQVVLGITLLMDSVA